MIPFLDILKSKCPNCRKGNVFSYPGNIFLLKMPKMNERCQNCNYKFEKETGFFFGAMFVSYAVAAAIMIALMVIGWYLLDMAPLNVFIAIVILIILSSTWNFRLSRTIWIYMFYNKE